MQIIANTLTVKDEDVPSADILGAYVESLKTYRQDNPDMNEDWASHIDKLPSARFIRQEYSNEECKLLFETINYLWRKISGQDIVNENKTISSPTKLLGNYWLIRNGILLEGLNSYTIIKNNAALFASLLHLNSFTLQCYLAGDPKALTQYIILNGGVRMFIRKNGEAFFQMTGTTYGDWARNKLKKFDFRKKTIRLIDPNVEYVGWHSGQPVII